MTGYSAEIVESSKQLTGKEKVMLKDTTICTKLDTASAGDGVLIDVDYYAVIDIHNENSEDKEYRNYVIVDKSGERYVTGSESFWSSFKDIFTDMDGESEPWQLKVYRVASKKREGKYFLTCSIV